MGKRRSHINRTLMLAAATLLFYSSIPASALLQPEGIGGDALSNNRVIQSEAPSIEITRVPPKGGGPDRLDIIAGKVSRVDFKRTRVVIFARTNTWYVQPYLNSVIKIESDGSFQTQTHLGEEYAALLVTTSYSPPATTDALPSKGADVLAIAIVPASDDKAPSRTDAAQGATSPEAEGTRTIRFSGYAWKVKSSTERVGPGPNYFSDSKENVYVDAKGRLHLRIVNRDRRWYCAEVISAESFGYGTYRFYIDSTIDNLDPQVVLGLFTWSDAPDFNHREIDIEISRWGNAENANAQFVIQPYTDPQNIVRFSIPAGLNASTHSFEWRPDQVICQSSKGAHAAPKGARHIIQKHSFKAGVPRAGDENARMNLWIVGGLPNANLKEMEVVIRAFEFIPLR